MCADCWPGLLSSPGLLTACLVTFLTGASSQWYQPSLEPALRQQFGLSAFQVSIFHQNCI